MCTKVRESEYFKCKKSENIYESREKPPLEWT